MDPSVTLFDPLDTFLAPVIPYVMLVLIVLNIVARGVEFNQIKRQATEGTEAINRHPIRVATNFLLVVGAFYYLSVERHAGMIVSVLVLAVFITDLFEFESRKVETRQGWDLDRPWGAIGASFFAFLYIAYQSLFFIVAPVWELVV